MNEPIIDSKPRLLLGVAPLVISLVWAVVEPSRTSCFTGMVIWGLAGALFGQRRNGRSLRYGAAAGFASVIAFLACFWPKFLIGSFFHQGPGDYFEDGFIDETFIYPVVFFLVYAPFAAGLGAVIGAVISFASHRLVRPSS